MNNRSVRRLIAARVEALGGQKVLAAELGVSKQYVSMILSGARPVPKRVLAFFDLGQEVSYRPLQPAQKPVRNGAASATVARQKREGRNHAKSPRAQQPVD